jgi:Rod binding domain-containing protein
MTTPIGGFDKSGTPAAAPLTPDQQSALKRLHQATTQLEGVFLQMVMHEMSKSVPKDSLTGKQSSAEETFSGMLDDERAKAIAQTGTLGISKVLDQQLRASVLADAAHESKFDVNRELER